MPQHCCRKSDIDPRAVVEAMLDAWTRRDLEETLGYFSDDVGYNIDLTAAEVPFAGASHGKTQLREQLQRILDIFITVLRAPEIYRVSGNRVYARNHVYYLHRSSRQFYELHYRTSYVVENGLIIKGTSTTTAPSWQPSSPYSPVRQVSMERTLGATSAKPAERASDTPTSLDGYNGSPMLRPMDYSPASALRNRGGTS